MADMVLKGNGQSVKGPVRPHGLRQTHLKLSTGQLERSRKHRKQLRVQSLPEIKRDSHAIAIPAQFYHYVEKSQETARSIYLKALPGPLKWAPSYLVPLAAFLGMFGSVHAHYLLQYLHHLQVPAWLPVASELQYHYGQHAQLANIAVDTLAGAIGALLVFFGLPALDLILGQDPGTGEMDAEKRPIFKAMLQSHVALYWLAIGGALWTCGNSDIHPLTVLALALSVAQVGAMSFVVSHELLHSPKKTDKLIASAGLMPLAYMHWIPSHLAHHRKVGTPEDPTTARLGETLYNFLPRTVVGNVRDGIEVELARLQSQHLPILSLHNRAFQWILGPLGLLAASYMLWGPKAACLGILQALVADLMLETVNYVEHYGLTRKPQNNGQFEKITIQHSWNANWLFTNSIIFSLQRHSDHHAHAYKPYQELKNLTTAPQLPASYPVMIMLAFFPGLFQDFMNPRAIAAARSEEKS